MLLKAMDPSSELTGLPSSPALLNLSLWRSDAPGPRPGEAWDGKQHKGLAGTGRTSEPEREVAKR